MKSLITGVAGFVGTNLSLHLLKDSSNEIIGVDSLSRRGSEHNLEYIKNHSDRFSFYQREIEDVPSLIHEVSPDIVYHFAAQVAVTSSVFNPVRDFRINAEGTFNIARTAREIGVPVIYTSTNKVFGDNVNNVPIIELPTRYDFDGELREKGLSESFSIDAKHHTPYGCSKLVGDIYVREFQGIVNRCSCMYGEHQHGIVDQGWMSHIARQIISGKQVTIFGDGKQVRDALHSSDLVQLLELEGKKLLFEPESFGGEVFNVGGGYENTVSLLELCEMWGVREKDIDFRDWRPADQKVFYCDISKAEKLLGWKPKMGIDEGLKGLFEWTTKNMSA